MTRKQVSYWARIRLIQPSLRDLSAHGGRPALFYTGHEVVKAMIVCELRRAGFSLHQVQRIVRNLEEGGLPLAEPRTYLLTDGHSVYYAFSDDGVVDVFKRHRQLLLLLPVHDFVDQVCLVA